MTFYKRQSHGPNIHNLQVLSFDSSKENMDHCEYDVKVPSKYHRTRPNGPRSNQHEGVVKTRVTTSKSEFFQKIKDKVANKCLRKKSSSVDDFKKIPSYRRKLCEEFLKQTLQYIDGYKETDRKSSSEFQDVKVLYKREVKREKPKSINLPKGSTKTRVIKNLPKILRFDNKLPLKYDNENMFMKREIPADMKEKLYNDYEGKKSRLSRTSRHQPKYNCQPRYPATQLYRSANALRHRDKLYARDEGGRPRIDLGDYGERRQSKLLMKTHLKTPPQHICMKRDYPVKKETHKHEKNRQRPALKYDEVQEKTSSSENKNSNEIEESYVNDNFRENDYVCKGEEDNSSNEKLINDIYRDIFHKPSSNIVPKIYSSSKNIPGKISDNIPFCSKHGLKVINFPVHWNNLIPILKDNVCQKSLKTGHNPEGIRTMMIRDEYCSPRQSLVIQSCSCLSDREQIPRTRHINAVGHKCRYSKVQKCFVITILLIQWSPCLILAFIFWAISYPCTPALEGKGFCGSFRRIIGKRFRCMLNEACRYRLLQESPHKGSAKTKKGKKFRLPLHEKVKTSSQQKEKSQCRLPPPNKEINFSNNCKHGNFFSHWLNRQQKLICQHSHSFIVEKKHDQTTSYENISSHNDQPVCKHPLQNFTQPKYCKCSGRRPQHIIKPTCQLNIGCTGCLRLQNKRNNCCLCHKLHKPEFKRYCHCSRQKGDYLCGGTCQDITQHMVCECPSSLTERSPDDEWSRHRLHREKVFQHSEPGNYGNYISKTTSYEKPINLEPKKRSYSSEHMELNSLFSTSRWELADASSNSPVISVTNTEDSSCSVFQMSILPSSGTIGGYQPNVKSKHSRSLLNKFHIKQPLNTKFDGEYTSDTIKHSVDIKRVKCDDNSSSVIYKEKGGSGTTTMIRKDSCDNSLLEVNKIQNNKSGLKLETNDKWCFSFSNWCRSLRGTKKENTMTSASNSIIECENKDKTVDCSPNANKIDQKCSPLIVNDRKTTKDKELGPNKQNAHCSTSTPILYNGFKYSVNNKPARNINKCPYCKSYLWQSDNECESCKALHILKCPNKNSAYPKTCQCNSRLLIQSMKPACQQEIEHKCCVRQPNKVECGWNCTQNQFKKLKCGCQCKSSCQKEELICVRPCQKIYQQMDCDSCHSPMNLKCKCNHRRLLNRIKTACRRNAECRSCGYLGKKGGNICACTRCEIEKPECEQKYISSCQNQHNPCQHPCQNLIQQLECERCHSPINLKCKCNHRTLFKKIKPASRQNAQCRRCGLLRRTEDNVCALEKLLQKSECKRICKSPCEKHRSICERACQCFTQQPWCERCQSSRRIKCKRKRRSLRRRMKPAFRRTRSQNSVCKRCRLPRKIQKNVCNKCKCSRQKEGFVCETLPIQKCTHQMGCKRCQSSKKAKCKGNRRSLLKRTKSACQQTCLQNVHCQQCGYLLKRQQKYCSCVRHKLENTECARKYKFTCRKKFACQKFTQQMKCKRCHSAMKVKCKCNRRPLLCKMKPAFRRTSRQNTSCKRCRKLLKKENNMCNCARHRVGKPECERSCQTKQIKCGGHCQKCTQNVGSRCSRLLMNNGAVGDCRPHRCNRHKDMCQYLGSNYKRVSQATSYDGRCRTKPTKKRKFCSGKCMEFNSLLNNEKITCLKPICLALCEDDKMSDVNYTTPCSAFPMSILAAPPTMAQNKPIIENRNVRSLLNDFNNFEQQLWQTSLDDNDCNVSDTKPPKIIKTCVERDLLNDCINKENAGPGRTRTKTQNNISRVSKSEAKDKRFSKFSRFFRTTRNKPSVATVSTTMIQDEMIECELRCPSTNKIEQQCSPFKINKRIETETKLNAPKKRNIDCCTTNSIFCEKCEHLGCPSTKRVLNVIECQCCKSVQNCECCNALLLKQPKADCEFGASFEHNSESYLPNRGCKINDCACSKNKNKDSFSVPTKCEMFNEQCNCCECQLPILEHTCKVELACSGQQPDMNKICGRDHICLCTREMQQTAECWSNPNYHGQSVQCDTSKPNSIGKSRNYNDINPQNQRIQCNTSISCGHRNVYNNMYKNKNECKNNETGTSLTNCRSKCRSLKKNVHCRCQMPLLTNTKNCPSCDCSEKLECQQCNTSISCGQRNMLDTNKNESKNNETGTSLTNCRSKCRSLKKNYHCRCQMPLLTNEKICPSCDCPENSENVCTRKGPRNTDCANIKANYEPNRCKRSVTCDSSYPRYQSRKCNTNNTLHKNQSGQCNTLYSNSRNESGKCYGNTVKCLKKQDKQCYTSNPYQEKDTMGSHKSYCKRNQNAGRSLLHSELMKRKMELDCYRDAFSKKKADCEYYLSRLNKQNTTKKCNVNKCKHNTNTYGGQCDVKKELLKEKPQENYLRNKNVQCYTTLVNCEKQTGNIARDACNIYGYRPSIKNKAAVTRFHEANCGTFNKRCGSGDHKTDRRNLNKICRCLHLPAKKEIICSNSRKACGTCTCGTLKHKGTNKILSGRKDKICSCVLSSFENRGTDIDQGQGDYYCQPKKNAICECFSSMWPVIRKNVTNACKSLCQVNNTDRSCADYYIEKSLNIPCNKTYRRCETCYPCCLAFKRFCYILSTIVPCCCWCPFTFCLYGCWKLICMFD